jgi:AGCS family alanine or glycine:cation symporter
METLNAVLTTINDILWHDIVLFVILAVGLLLIVWTKFGPLVALTHGVAVIRGKYDDKKDPGAISHFQALSAALSATVGLGNIGGVALAVALGGPGAVFWMWVVGIAGMALKMTEVTQSMLYRQTDDPDNPHGGPMFVVSEGLARMRPSLAPLGRAIGYIFCVTLLVSTVTGGNMFQAWNVGNVTRLNFGVPELLTGLILAMVTATVIIGGIKRIGAVAGRLVPFMCGLYLLAALYVVALNIEAVPGLIGLIFVSAFSPTEAQGAFLGGTLGYAFLWGMKRALFSNEAGQGSAPIAHAAAKTNEPVREGIVAGLGPFIDTIVVCTLTALVILASGAWNRPAVATFETPPAIVASGPGQWTLESGPLPSETDTPWRAGQDIFVVLDSGVVNERTGSALVELRGVVIDSDDHVDWGTVEGDLKPTVDTGGIHVAYTGASLTSHAFDRVQPGLGRWLVTLASWLFAVSTIISWNYYGEQGIIFLLGAQWIRSYRVVYCLLIIVATSGFITTDRELDALTGLGTGVMLFANIPIILIFSGQAMKRYHEYMRRLRSGAMQPHA